MSNIGKILDRVRKMLALAEHSDSEAEAALAAGRAAKLMDEYQLSEALVRLDDPEAKPEAILRDARLEPDAKGSRKRVAWKETISRAVSQDLGVHTFFRYTTHWTGNTMRRVADVRGVGRESAIQTWQYTCQYLWRQIEELADKAWEAEVVFVASMGVTRAWKNAFRAGCAGRIAERIYENRKTARAQAKHERDSALARINSDAAAHQRDGRFSNTENDERQTMAISIVEKDQAEVDSEYENVKRTFTAGSAPGIGSTSSHSGYSAGRAAGDRVSLGSKRAGLPAGQGRLKS